MPIFPKWIVDEVRLNKGGLRGGASLKTAEELARHGLRTVCDEARCPNKGRCFSNGEATFLILGNVCTRACSFCAVTKKTPLPPDPGEPFRTAELLKKWGLKYVVLTSPTRDDLPDGGASHFAKTVREVKRLNPGLKTELLIPDFKGSSLALETVLGSEPSVLGHNIETAASLYGKVRTGADYKRSLELLARSKKFRPDIFTKSGIMLGLGETETEIETTLKDLLARGCDLLTIGQYLAPSKNHFPVKKYYTPGEFSGWGEKARKMGFKAALSGPLVRSSYRALSLYREARLKA